MTAVAACVIVTIAACVFADARAIAAVCMITAPVAMNAWLCPVISPVTLT